MLQSMMSRSGNNTITCERTIRTRLQAVTEPLIEPSSGASTTEWAALEDADGRTIGMIPCRDTSALTLIGRSGRATIVLDDPYVHREHAGIRWDPASNAHVLEDGGGLNGTFLDEKRVLYPHRLRDGARIRVGHTEIVYRRTVATPLLAACAGDASSIPAEHPTVALGDH